MAPLDTDGALRSMCRVVAQLLHPDQKELEQSDHNDCLDVCQKLLQTEPKTSEQSSEVNVKINSELHLSRLRTEPVTVSTSRQPEQAQPKQKNPGGLSTWAKEEAVRHFRENLAIDDKWSNGWSYARSELCVAHFRKLLDCWYPGRKDFWKECQDFCKEWAGWQSGPPRCRPLSAGRLNNYLSHLHRGSTHRMEEILPTPEIMAAVHRYGIRVSDIRLTSPSIFEVCQAWTGLDWRVGHAADPCPWPVPHAFDGLKCSWQLLAKSFGRVYLNPPWSQLDCWLQKAAWEYSFGLQILMVVPRWSEDSCIAILTSAQKSLRLSTPLRLKTRRLWDAEFKHPASGSSMAPLDVTLIWMI
ncbi:unnamed protein product [Durusdinium trenchii]|uniref:Uncharacterized protein n=1 Tax=Durusdinium trenchii TaxID=1381693 RepID=A0ABP0IUF3_9DINO